MKRFVFQTVLAVCAALLVAVPGASAQVIKNIPPLTRGVSIPKDAFMEMSQQIVEVPFGDRYLSYKIRLPKDWTKIDDRSLRNVRLSNRVMGEVTKYYGPPKLDTRSFFRIRALRLDHEITARNWFLNYALSEGVAIQGLAVKDDRKIESEYVIFEDKESYTVRAVAEINGPRMLIAEYCVPTAYAKEDRDPQVWSMVSFRMTNPERGPIEKRNNYGFLDLAQFNYPASWELKAAPVKSIERMGVFLVSTRKNYAKKTSNQDQVEGRIDITVVSKELGTSLAQEAKTVLKGIETKDVAVGALIEKIPGLKMDKSISEFHVEAYALKSKNVDIVLDYELWVAFLSGEGNYFVVTMTLPGRESEFYEWARGTEAFKQVVQSIRK